MRFLAATLLLATPAIAADQPAPSGKEKKICQATEPATGSRMGPRRICRTAAEWEAVRSANFKDMEARQRNGLNQKY